MKKIENKKLKLTFQTLLSLKSHTLLSLESHTCSFVKKIVLPFSLKDFYVDGFGIYIYVCVWLVYVGYGS